MWNRRHLLFTSERRTPISAAGFRKQLAVIGLAAGSPSLSTRTCCGMRAASRSPMAGTTRAIQEWLGHRNIQHITRYTELTTHRFKDFWQRED